MLSSLEMVSEPSGKTKTLGDLIKEVGILTPETPVYTSDDSTVLKDYIESLIPAPTPSYSETVLFDNPTFQSTGNPSTIALSKSAAEFDMLCFNFIHWKNNTNDIYLPVTLLVSQIEADKVVFGAYSDKNVYYKFTDLTNLTRTSVSTSQNVVIRKIIGIKF